jgi:prepilin-type N-terminal cleavage/methylation domain-containing protein
MSSPTTRRSGFTLIEVLVAVSIMAIGLVAVLRTGIQSQETMFVSDRISEATLLAGETMGQIQARGLDSLFGLQGDYGEERPGYIWKVETDNHRHPGLTHVLVTVDWEGNTVRPVKLEAYLFDAQAAHR